MICLVKQFHYSLKLEIPAHEERPDRTSPGGYEIKINPWPKTGLWPC
jgi:hypothetical protein